MPTARDSMAEVFLSPRVVDRGAFEDFAARLRAVIAEAGDEARRLEEASPAAAQSREDLRAGTQKNAEQTQRAVELAKALGDRIRALENSLARASRLAEGIDRVEARIDAILAPLAEREAALQALLNRIESAAATIGRVVSDDGSTPALSHALESAQSAAARLAEVEALADAASSRLQRSLDGAVEFTDRILVQHEAIRSEGNRSLDELRDALRARDALAADLVRMANALKGIAAESTRDRGRDTSARAG